MDNKTEQSGFTIIEVMLVLGLTGLLLVGLLGGTFSSISNQRYNDSVRSFAEYLRTVYNEVLNPESLGSGTSGNQAIYGKILVFGADENTNDVYSATLVGDATIPETGGGDFVTELASVGPRLFCGEGDSATTVANYVPLWQAELTQTGSNFPNKFEGTVVIARAPTTGAVHTVYVDKVYDIKDDCSGASDTFNTDIQEFADDTTGTKEPRFDIQTVGICVKSEDVSRYREIRIAEDGRNTSAIWTLNADAEENGERSQCGD